MVGMITFMFVEHLIATTRNISNLFCMGILSCVFCVEKTVELTPSSGVVYARSSQPLKVKVKPRESGERQFSIKYCLTSSKHGDHGNSIPIQSYICRGYARLKVTWYEFENKYKELVC